MKINKKIFAFVFTTILCLFLIGCSSFKKGSVYSGNAYFLGSLKFDTPNKGSVTIERDGDELYATYTKTGDIITIVYGNGDSETFTIFENYLINNEAIETGDSSFSYSVQKITVKDSTIKGEWSYRYFDTDGATTYNIKFESDGTYNHYVGDTWGVPQYEEGNYKVEGNLLTVDDDKYLIYNGTLITIDDTYTKSGR